jgi:hypothetical protein
MRKFALGVFTERWITGHKAQWRREGTTQTSRPRGPELGQNYRILQFIVGPFVVCSVRLREDSMLIGLGRDFTFANIYIGPQIIESRGEGDRLSAPIARHYLFWGQFIFV